ncbi:MAG: AraC family transcriptional regulator [Clostridiales bacterium]|jgi:AraC-like DNA-binding protein|nr:AraC family transcriptional regulator [Clostridiales bacterium]
MTEFEKERSLNDLLYHQFNENLTAGLHFHNSYEFIYLYGGAMDVQINKKNYELKGGRATLVLPGQVHALRTRGDSKNYLCIFARNHIGDFADMTENVELVNPVFDFPHEEYIEIFSKKDTNKFLQKAFLYLVSGLASSAGVTPVRHTEDRLLIYKITDYINKNYRDTITLKGIAKDLGYNYSYLSNFFNEHLASGFSKFINEYRVGYAKNLLSGTAHSMSQIAFDCGFSSIRNFNRAFLQIERLSPKDFRRGAAKERL